MQLFRANSWLVLGYDGLRLTGEEGSALAPSQPWEL